MGIKFPMDLLQSSHLISAAQKKLLYVNSYHAGYKWSDDIEMGLLKALNITKNDQGSYDDSGSEVQLQVFRMDTKLHPSEVFKARSALAAKTIVDEWQPDIVVISDDNAAKYLVVPYLKGGKIPVVFCGLNWSADMYGFSPEIITGMVEVDPILETIALMRPYARGGRIGYLGAQMHTDEKELAYFKNVQHLSFADGELVKDFHQWQQAYLRLQKTVDMLIVLSSEIIPGWNEDRAQAFIEENTAIPTGCLSDNVVRFTLLGKVKIAEEQGWWAGNTALSILEGTPVRDIPVTENKHFNLYLNMKMARKLGVKFPIELLEQATLLQE